ncbi:MAG: hypothetical protein RLY86_134 [Pseudomonadota bacterium]|jgi:hypothetical protein
MASSFIPTGPVADDQVVRYGTWWPPLSVAECRAQTGLGQQWPTLRVAAELQLAAASTVASIANWVAGQSADSLAQVGAEVIDGEPLAVRLWKAAVYRSVRARLVDVTRDHDSTARGHDRADALEPTADAWRQQAQEALALLTGRGRTVVELI